MPCHHLRASRYDIPGLRRIRITSADRYPPASRQKGQGAHPRACYPHEVDWAGIVGGEKIHRSGS
jgi:hypothetical protein